MAHLSQSGTRAFWTMGIALLVMAGPMAGTGQALPPAEEVVEWVEEAPGGPIDPAQIPSSSLAQELARRAGEIYEYLLDHADPGDIDGAIPNGTEINPELVGELGIMWPEVGTENAMVHVWIGLIPNGGPPGEDAYGFGLLVQRKAVDQVVSKLQELCEGGLGC